MCACVHACVSACVCACRDISYQLAILMTIFAYKLAMYLSTGDVDSLENAVFCGNLGLVRSVGCALQFLGHIGLLGCSWVI